MSPKFIQCSDDQVTEIAPGRIVSNN